MTFWNYIGEFLLFRWLFGSHKHKEAKCYGPDVTAYPVDSESFDDLDSYIDDSYSRYDNHNYGYSQSYDDFLDEQDDFDMMDDDF